MHPRLRATAIGLMTGLGTGLFVASAEWFLQRDGTLDGLEALSILPLPLAAALLVAFGCGERRLTGRLAAVAYLTLAIPLFGIGIGGADIPQQVVGGAIGGAFWSIPFALTSRSTG